jgi:hypothetical protein
MRVLLLMRGGWLLIYDERGEEWCLVSEAFKASKGEEKV